jgi:hypothetical protein
MVTFVKLLQPLNALFPINVTEEGMVTLVKRRLPENTEFPIAVTGKPAILPGISKNAAFPVYPVIATVLLPTIS